MPLTEPTYPREVIVSSAKIFGKVRDHVALREAIDSSPHLFSARLSNDYHAIMVELNQYLPDGYLVTVDDVRRAMDLRAVVRPTGLFAVAGHATGAGGA